MRAVVLCWLAQFAPCLVIVSSTAATTADYDPSPGLRRPVALALAQQDGTLFIANRNGTISIADTSKERVVGEFTAGSRLADIAVYNSGHLLVADEETNQLLLLAWNGTKLNKGASLKLPPHPVKVRVSKDECFVALLWARAIAVVDVNDLKLKATIPLSFAPREMLVANGRSLIVADAFGGNLAVIDLGRREVESVRPLPAHNIRGLALSSDGKQLYVAHQTLSPLARTTSDDIRWGNLIGNHVRSLALRNVLNPDTDLLKDSELHSLGEVDEGAADPGALAVTSDGKLLVASSGTGQIFWSDETQFRFWRLGIGRHPTAITTTKDNERAYIADMFGDQILVADLNKREIRGQISLGIQRALTPIERGEELFFDARLSHKGWLSCHSCHTDGHSNGLLSDTFGDGSFGAPKRVLSLLGVGGTGPWGWNGSFTNLEEQVGQSIHSTMGGPVPSQEEVAFLTAFMKSLTPPPASSIASRARGQEIFNKHCAECHQPSAYTSARTYDVGLTDEVGGIRFNPPSLRGLSQRERYFHDNRAKTLESVFVEFKHGFETPPSSGDVAELLGFLRTL